MIEAVESRVPGLGASIRVQELSTPLSTEHFTRSVHGAAYGLAHGPERFACPHLRPRTPIDGLYLTGQDVASCGIMGALSGALTTTSVILRRNMFSLMQRTPPIAEAAQNRRAA
jgi:phytoene dehydrogenase-like protein